jgi:hypothetical protein
MANNVTKSTDNKRATRKDGSYKACPFSRTHRRPKAVSLGLRYRRMTGRLAHNAALTIAWASQPTARYVAIPAAKNDLAHDAPTAFSSFMILLDVVQNRYVRCGRGSDAIENIIGINLKFDFIAVIHFVTDCRCDIATAEI